MSARAPWYLRAGAWIGVGTSPGALMTGAGLGAGRGLPETVGVIVAGSALIAALAVAQGLLGRRQGVETVQLAQRAFGTAAGPALVAGLIVTGVVCWDGFYLGLVAGALGDVLGIPAPVAATALAVLVWVVYRTGFRRWNLLVALTGVAALAVGVFTLAAVPPGPSSPPRSGPPLGFAVAGLGVVVAYGAIFAVRAADFTSDAPRRRDVWLPGVALFASLAAFLILGAAVEARAGSADVSTLVTGSRAPQLGAALLTLSILAPVVSGLHSGALGLTRLLGWPAPLGAGAVAAGAAALGAARFDRQLLPFLALLGALVPPLAAVLLLGRPSGAGGTAWHSWAGWAAGSAVSLAALAAGLPVSVLLGIATAGAVVLALGLLRPRARLP